MIKGPLDNLPTSAIPPVACSICLDPAHDHALHACGTCTAVVHLECLRQWDERRGNVLSVWRWQPAQCLLGHPLANHIMVMRRWHGRVEWTWTPILSDEASTFSWPWRAVWSTLGVGVNAFLCMFGVYLFLLCMDVGAFGLLCYLLHWLPLLGSSSQRAYVVLDRLMLNFFQLLLLLTCAYHLMSLLMGCYLHLPPRPLYDVVYKEHSQ